jgi:adenylate cyclase
MPGREARRGTILFTDIIGYRDLAQHNESHALELLRTQRELLFETSAEHGGQGSKPPNKDSQLGLKGWLRGAGLKEKTGSKSSYSILIFDNPLDAVRCAVQFQRKLLEHNKTVPRDRELHSGVGIDVGEYEIRGEEVFGEPVGLVSRIWDQAGPGEICVTAAVSERVRGELEQDLEKLARRVEGLPNAPELFRIEIQGEARAMPVREASKNRIAVLPFSSMSPDPNDEYFADGLTEELISTISKINELEVISRTSVMFYKKTPKPIKELSKELDVGTILEGSVRKGGNKLRVTVQMIDALKDTHLWANSYDREIQDVFAIQSDIAERVADALKLQLIAKVRRNIEKKPTDSSEAYTLYLRGRFHWNQRSSKAVKEAIKYFEEAIKIDPAFAKAYSGLSDCYQILIDRGIMPTGQALPLSKNYAEKSLELDPELSEGHASLGSAAMSSFDFMRAEKEFRRAIELNPNYSMAYHWLSLLLRHLRRYQESYEMEKEALRLDPHLFILNLGMGICLAYLGKTEEAIDQFGRTLPLSPDAHSGVELFTAITLSSVGKYSQAIEEMKKIWREDEGEVIPSWFKLNLALTYAMAGQTREAAEILNREQSQAEKVYISPAYVAIANLAIGKRDEGFKWLERAFAEHDGLVMYLRAMPWLRKYWSDPNWVEIERKAGIAQQY